MSGTPAYVQVASDLRSQIEAGDLPSGGQLPSMAKLRETYRVSNTVVRDALNELRREGLIVGQQGKGVFVREKGEAAPNRPGAGPDVAALANRLADVETQLRELWTRVNALEVRG